MTTRRSRKRIQGRRRSQIREYSAHSLKKFLQVVKDIDRDWGNNDLWFRGQPNARQDLKPRTYRSRKAYEDEAEDERRYEFRRTAIQFISGRQPSGDWEWYFLMQHYGIPTRLLDWSEGALLALYFALRFNKGRTDGAVWVLSPRRLQEFVLRQAKLLPRTSDPEYKFMLKYLPDPADERTKWIRDYLPMEFSNARLPNFPAIVKPPHIDRRIAVQLSVFTIHGAIHKGLEKVAQQAPQPCLAKIRIPRRTITMLLGDLENLGIKETTVFPDMEGLGRELSDW